MNNKRAKKIKAGVLETYGELSAMNLKIVLASKKFKAMYRAAKKNFHLNKNSQSPKLKESKRQQRLAEA